MPVAAYACVGAPGFREKGISQRLKPPYEVLLNVRAKARTYLRTLVAVHCGVAVDRGCFGDEFVDGVGLGFVFINDAGLQDRKSVV